MRTHGLFSLITLAALFVLPSFAEAGVAFFSGLRDTIRVSGETVFGTAATYEAIILYPSAHNGGATIFNEWQDFQEDKYLAVVPGASGSLLGFNFGASSGVASAPVAVSFDQWHHVAYVYDGSEERLYLDGTLVQSRAASGDVNDSEGSASQVGAIFRDGAVRDGFIGLIDVLRLSNVARYAGASFTPPSPNLTADQNTVLLYTFDDPPGSTTVADSSSLARTGTLGVGFGGATSPSLCGANTTDADGDFIPDSCTQNPSVTTTTTEPTVGTTSTTLPGGSCDGVGDGPTFTSLTCRIAALIAAVEGESQLGSIRAKLVTALQVANARRQAAESECASGNTKRARKRLRQTGKKIAQFSHRLRSNSTRKKVPEGAREPLALGGDAIRTDAKTLQRTVACSAR